MLCFTLLYVVALCVKMRYVILCIKRLLIDWLIEGQYLPQSNSRLFGPAENLNSKLLLYRLIRSAGFAGVPHKLLIIVRHKNALTYSQTDAERPRRSGSNSPYAFDLR